MWLRKCNDEYLSDASFVKYRVKFATSSNHELHSSLVAQILI